jgi:hypothetical protein
VAPRARAAAAVLVATVGTTVRLVHPHTCLDTQTYTHMPSHTRTNAHARTHTCIQARTYTHIHTHAHTHIRTEGKEKIPGKKKKKMVELVHMRHKSLALADACLGGSDGNECQNGGVPTGTTGFCSCDCTDTGFGDSNCQTGHSPTLQICYK